MTNITYNAKRASNFLSKSLAKYGTKYDYSLVEYINAHTAVKIVCMEHGTFQKRPSDHLNSNQGCPTCGKNRVNLLSKSTFASRCSDVHDGKYDYSKYDYVNSETASTIICPIHGEFTQRAKSHLTGSGCQSCANINRAKGNVGYNESNIDKWGFKSGYFYIIELSNNDEKFLKCGITIDTKSRFSHYRAPKTPYSISRVLDIMEMKLSDAFDMEQRMLRTVEKYSPKHHFSGHTECFKITKQ